MRRGKSKRRLLFLPHREAQRQKKKGNKKSMISFDTLLLKININLQFICRYVMYFLSFYIYMFLSSVVCFNNRLHFSYCSYSSSSSNSSSKSEPPDVTSNTLINTFPRAPSTSDSIRLKCREMLANALQAGGSLLLRY